MHRVDAKPSLVARARTRRPRRRHRRRARDRLVAGAAAGIGQREDSAAAAPGYFEATSRLQAARSAPAVDRSMGDIHPLGNPHVQLDPHNIAVVAKALTARLAQIDPRKRRLLRAARRGFPGALAAGDRALGGAGRAAQGRAGRRHPQGPGVSVPLARAQAARRDRAQAGRAAERRLPRGARDEARCDAAEDDPAQRLQRSEGGRLARRSACTRPVVLLPFSVGGTPEAKDLFGLFDDTINKLLAAAK